MHSILITLAQEYPGVKPVCVVPRELEKSEIFYSDNEIH